MRTSPRRTTRIDNALPQKKFRQAMSASHQIPASILTGTDQISGCLLFYRRDRDLDDLVQSEQPRQMQRVAIARALVSKPSVLVLDEPTEGIQPSIIKEIAQSLNRLRKELGIAVLVSEQVLSFAMEVADEILVLDLGRIVRTATKNAVDIEEVRSYLTV